MAGIRGTLMSAAREGETVTYGTLMKRFHLSRGRALTNAIAEVDEGEASRGAPGFAAIVVRKDTGFPGGGYFCDDGLPAPLRRGRNRSTDPRLSREEREIALRRRKAIWAYYGAGRGRRPRDATT